MSERCVVGGVVRRMRVNNVLSHVPEHFGVKSVCLEQVREERVLYLHRVVVVLEEFKHFNHFGDIVSL